jgi:hypothetical protein
MVSPLKPFDDGGRSVCLKFRHIWCAADGSITPNHCPPIRATPGHGVCHTPIKQTLHSLTITPRRAFALDDTPGTMMRKYAAYSSQYWPKPLFTSRLSVQHTVSVRARSQIHLITRYSQFRHSAIRRNHRPHRCMCTRTRHALSFCQR